MVHVTSSSEHYIAFESQCGQCGPSCALGPTRPFANFVEPEHCRKQIHEDRVFAAAHGGGEDKLCLTRVWHSLPPNLRFEFFDRKTCRGYVSGRGCRNAHCTFHHPKVCPFGGECEVSDCVFFHPGGKMCGHGGRGSCKNQKCDLFHVNPK